MSRDMNTTSKGIAERDGIVMVVKGKRKRPWPTGGPVSLFPSHSCGLGRGNEQDMQQCYTAVAIAGEHAWLRH